jgi:adenylate cyclase
MRICSRKIKIDPYYADDWALIALAQRNLRYQYYRQVDDGFATAHAALAIDPTIAEAHLPMFKRLQERRQFDAAAAEMETAIRLGPESWSVNKEAGRFYLMQRDLGTATRHYEKAVEIMDTDFHAWAMLATCYQATGESAKRREAAKKMVSEAQRAIQQDPSNGAALDRLAPLYNAGSISCTVSPLQLGDIARSARADSPARVASTQAHAAIGLLWQCGPHRVGSP